MSEETTGATTESTSAAESAMPTPDATVQSATTDPAATPSPVETPVEDAAATPALPAAPATADTATGADAPEVDPMDLAMQQMPPLNEIEVPGSESGGNNGGRGGRGGNGGGRGGNRYSENSNEPRAGQVVTGTVVHIDSDGVLVDVGMKSEGLIRPNELSREPVQNVEDLVKVGDKIDVFVMDPERDGTLLLSKKRADFEKAWDKVQEALVDGRTIQAMVNDRVKGGLVVDLGIRGFVPASHVGNGKLKNLEKFVGQSVPLKVLEVDRQGRKVVLSHRLATEEERQKEKEETIAALGEGQTRTGTVRRVTDYGAFVDLGGIDGLLHVSEMSWTRIKHPSDVVKVGDQVQVQILKMSLDQGRVSLGMRQILPDPWLDVAEKFHVGDVIQGEVTRLVPFGAFVLLEGGIEGIIPNSELAHRRIAKPADVVEQGQMVEIKVIDVRPDERRLTLSLRALQAREPADDYRPAPRAGGVGAAPGGLEAPPAEDGGGRREKRERRGGGGGRGRDEGEGDFRQYMSSGGSGTGGGMTIGDMFGDLLASAGGKGAAKAGGKRGRRIVEEEDDDLSDIDGDIEEPVAVDAEEVTAEADETAETK